MSFFSWRLMLGYPVVYTFIYSNEVAREVPVAVVDHSEVSVKSGRFYPELGCHGECGM